MRVQRIRKVCLRATGMIKPQNKAQLIADSLSCKLFRETKTGYLEETAAVGLDPLNGLAHGEQVPQVFV